LVPNERSLTFLPLSPFWFKENGLEYLSLEFVQISKLLFVKGNFKIKASFFKEERKYNKSIY